MLMMSVQTKRTKKVSNKIEDSKESSMDPRSPIPELQEPESANKMSADDGNLGQGPEAQAQLTGPTTVATSGTEGGLTGDLIDFFSNAAPPQVGAEELKGNKVHITAREPTANNKDNSETRSVTGVKAESITAETLTTVVHNAYHLTESGTKMKSFSTAEAPSHTFVGRKEQLELVHKKLQEYCATQEHHMRRIVALISTPGMGKTEIARDFVQKYKDQYENVAWIDATTASSARAGFINLARLLKVEISNDDEGKDLARLVYAHISNQFEKPPLLIFDNAQGLETEGNVFGISDYLPTQVKRNLPLMLVTSRSDEWRKHSCEVVEVPRLTKEESFQFFSTVFRLSEKEEDSTLNGLLQQLGDKLDGHPIRLKKAEKFLSTIPDQYALSTLKAKVRNCIQKADGMEFSAEILNPAAVQELPAQSGSHDVTSTMAEQSNGTLIAKCVAAFAKTMKLRLSSLPFVDEIKFSEIQKAAIDEAMSVFKESRKTGDAQAAEDELMTKLTQTASVFQAQNKTQEILASYHTQLDSKIGEDVYDQDTIEVIQHELAVDAFKKMQDWLGLLQNHFKCPEKLLERVRANCERLDNEISSFTLETEADYRSALDPSKFRSEDELVKTEFQSRLKAMEALKNFSHKLPASKMSGLTADLTARLDDISENAREKVKNNEEILKEELDTAIQKAAAEYKKSMVGLLLSETGRIAMETNPSVSPIPNLNKVEQVFTIDHMPLIAPNNLIMFRRQSEEKSSRILSNFLDANNEKFKSPTQIGRKSKESLAELTSETYSYFQRLAHKKRESSKARKNVIRFEEDFRVEMEKLLVKTIQRHDSKVSNLQNRLRVRLQRTMDESILGPQSVQENMSSWDSRVEELIRQFKLTLPSAVEQSPEGAEAQASSPDLSTVEQQPGAETEKLVDKSENEQTVDLKSSNSKDRVRKRFGSLMHQSSTLWAQRLGRK